MNKLMKLVLFVTWAAIGAAIVFGATARAADATLTWTNPTQMTDGSAIPATGANALTQTAIVYGKCNAANDGLLATPAPVTVVVPAPAATKVITGLSSGRWCFAARSETASAQSVLTGFVSKDIVLTPAPPTNLTVAATTAYMAVRQENRYVMLPVGSVPGGVACDSNNGVIADGRSYFAVPREAVDWYGATQPEVALATCS